MDTIESLPYDITAQELSETEPYDKDMIATALQIADFYALKIGDLERLSHMTNQHIS